MRKSIDALQTWKGQNDKSGSVEEREKTIEERDTGIEKLHNLGATSQRWMENSGSAHTLEAAVSGMAKRKAKSENIPKRGGGITVTPNFLKTLIVSVFRLFPCNQQ